MNSAVSNQIREGKTHQIPSMMQMGGKQGMRLLNDSLQELVTSGAISGAEALAKSVDKDGLRTRLEGLGVSVQADAEPAHGSVTSSVEQEPQAPRPQPPAALPRQAEEAPAADDPFERFKQMRGR